MSDVTLGKILTGTHHRDAIHVAIAPVVAAESLSPGQEIGFIDDAKTRVGQSKKTLGIVDPFLTSDVRRDQQFYMFLFPQTVTGMRHEWQHPEFPAASVAAFSFTKEESEAWLRQFCANADCPGFDVTIAAAIGGSIPGERGNWISYRNNGEYLHFDGADAHAEIPPEFWDHVQNYTGIEIPKSERAEWFSCSC